MVILCIHVSSDASPMREGSVGHRAWRLTGATVSVVWLPSPFCMHTTSVTHHPCWWVTYLRHYLHCYIRFGIKQGLLQVSNYISL